jgi:hypothetical protein
VQLLVGRQLLLGLNATKPVERLGMLAEDKIAMEWIVAVMSKSVKNDETERAISWITDRVRHVAQASGVGSLAIEWKAQESLFIMQIEGKGKKKVAKLFEGSELPQYPLAGEQQLAFDAQLVRLVQFFKKGSRKDRQPG